ncbi:MAG: NIPSNAP family protein [Pseudohongiellaceae bacterium]|nr:NIPSNAP family protein [Pseudohongiellaceae bacterium]
MVTCHLKYTVDPFKLKEFKHYAQLWIALIPKFGGTHHGVFLPHEGESDIALVLFSFPSLAAYEEYREKSKTDKGCLEAMQYYNDTRCFLRFERSFFKPVFD